MNIDPFLASGIIISLVFSAFFSGIEIAFISSDPIHLQIQSAKKDLTARVLQYFSRKPTTFLTTTLVGNTIALVVYGTFMTKFLHPLLAKHLVTEGSINIILETVISTLIVLFTAEFLPKSLFLLNPNKVLSVLCIPMRIIIYLLYPLVFVIVVISRWFIINFFKSEYSEERPVYGLTDLNNFIQKISERQDVSEEHHELNSEIFSNALEFKKVKVRDCMVPRTDIISLDMESDISELRKAFTESGHTKVIIYKDSIDDIKGYCHASELFKKPKHIKDIITEIPIAPETKLANELLIELTKKHKSLALVVDEFGGTSGLVSIEDIIEEIFGEIQDEHDDEDLIEHQIDDYNFILSGRHEIEELNHKFSFNLPEGDYDTLGGLIFSSLGEIPKIGDSVNLNSITLVIRNMDGIKVDKVLLTRKM